MKAELTRSLVRILDAAGETAGAGFVLTGDGLIATCAHVIVQAGAGPGDMARLVFHQTGGQATAAVEPEGWREPDAEDIAILRLAGDLPNEVAPVLLGSGVGLADHPIQTFGFPDLSPEGGVWGDGHILGETTQQGSRLLQLSSPQITPGFSGAPVLDTVTRRVVGIATSIALPDRYGRLAETAFITPTESLRAVCPALQLSDICPYRGLAAFTEADAEFFFGREPLVADLVAHLRQNPRFLAVVGPSGSGKSSLVQAGLFPALRQGQAPGSESWHILSFRPGSDPFAALAGAGLALTAGQTLSQAISSFLASRPETKRLILFADQFEELFALAPGEMQVQFIADAQALLESDHPVTLILTLRADFYGHLLRYGSLVEALKIGQVNVPPLGPAELQTAIETPARLVGLDFEPGLVELITREAGQVDYSLPLLESALTQLWEKRDEGRLTRRAYQQIGQVTGALGRWAEDTYSALSQEEQNLAAYIFRRLVHYGESEVTDTRRRRTLAGLAPYPEIQETVHRLVQLLADRRLLITDRDQRAGQETAEIIHDALLREWKRLRHWLTEQREFYLWRQRLDTRLLEWQEERGELLRDASLTEAERWLAERPGDLNPPEELFIQTSIQNREREIAERTRQRRRIGFALGAIAVLVIGVLGISLWSSQQIAANERALAQQQQEAAETAEALAVEAQTAATAEAVARQGAEAAQAEAEAQRNEAERQQATAEAERARAQTTLSRLLGTQALDLLSAKQFDQALLLSLEAYQTMPTFEALNSLLAGLESSPHLNTLLRAEPSYYRDKVSNNILFSPDGGLLLAARQDYQIDILSWNVATGESRILQYELINTSDPPNNTVFSPDGRLLAVSSGRQGWHAIRLYDIASGQMVGNPIGVPGELGLNRVLAFTLDGQMLAASLTEDAVLFWDVATHELKHRIDGIPSYSPFAFSTDGSIVVVAADNRTIVLRDTATGQTIGAPIPAKVRRVNSLALSPDGRMLAISSKNFGEGGSPIVLWDVSGQQVVGEPLSDYPNLDNVTSLAFSPDGRLLAFAIPNEAVWLWNVTAGQLVELIASESLVTGGPMAFSSDGQMLAVISSSEVAMLFDVQPVHGIHRLLADYDTHVSDISFSSHGTILVARDSEGVVLAWDITTGQPTTPPSGDSEKPTEGNIQVLSDCLYWTRAGCDQFQILLSDTGTGKPIGQPIIGGPGEVSAWALSPDEAVLAVGTTRNFNAPASITLWNTTNGQQQAPPDFGSHTVTSTVTSLAFSPDGTWLAASSEDDAVILYDLTTNGGLSSNSHQGDQNQIASELAFSADSQLLASASADKILLWDVVTMEALVQLTIDPGNTMTELVFSPDGKWLAVGGISGLAIWNIDFEVWQARACQIVNRNFADEEWEQLFGDEPYRETCPLLP
jgi:WD40 repeat protein